MELTSLRYTCSKQIRWVWEETILPLLSLCLTMRWFVCAYSGILRVGRNRLTARAWSPAQTSGHSGMDGGPRCNLHCLGCSRYWKKEFLPGFQLALEIRSTFVSDISSLLYETVREEGCRKPSTSIQPTRSLTSTELSALNQKPWANQLSMICSWEKQENMALNMKFSVARLGWKR